MDRKAKEINDYRRLLRKDDFGGKWPKNTQNWAKNEIRRMMNDIKRENNKLEVRQTMHQTGHFGMPCGKPKTEYRYNPKGAYNK